MMHAILEHREPVVVVEAATDPRTNKGSSRASATAASPTSR
jgi:hypothetical protein